MKIVRHLIIFITISILTGCYSMGTDNAPPPAPLVKFTPQQTVTKLWSTSIGGGIGEEDYLKLGPVIANNKIFIADKDDYVSAVDISSGNKLWKVDTKQTITSGPSATNNIVVIATAEPQLIALNPESGAIVWRANLPNQTLAAPKIAGDRIIVKTIDGKLIAFAINNGQKLWTYDHGSPTLILRASSSPQVIGNLVIAGFPDGKLIAVSLNQGKFMWDQVVAIPQGATQAEQLVDIAADPVSNNGIVYVATYQGKIAAVNVQTGNVLWQQNISTYTGSVLGPNALFVTDAEGYVWAFNRTNGKVSWKQTDLHYRVLTTPELMNNTVVVGDGEGYLHWLAQTDGHLVARTLVKNKASIVAPPVVLGNVLFAVTNDGKLTAWRLS